MTKTTSTTLNTTPKAAGPLRIYVSLDWNGSTPADLRIGQAVCRLDKTPEAIRYFDDNQSQLSDYWYWFLLGTLWVSYTGWSELGTWKRLFSSERKNRATSLMKPSELHILSGLTDPLLVYRAHRPGETDWLAYTYDPQKAAEFAVRRGVGEVSAYQVARADVLALFARRGESEILVLDRSRVRFQGVVPVVVEGSVTDAH